jgi:hypothetical protein
MDKGLYAMTAVPTNDILPTTQEPHLKSLGGKRLITGDLMDKGRAVWHDGSVHHSSTPAISSQMEDDFIIVISKWHTWTKKFQSLEKRFKGPSSFIRLEWLVGWKKLQRPIQRYHFQSVVRWSDGPFKKFSEHIGSLLAYKKSRLLRIQVYST